MTPAAASTASDPKSDGQIAYESAFSEDNRVPFLLIPDWMQLQWHRKAAADMNAPTVSADEKGEGGVSALPERLSYPRHGEGPYFECSPKQWEKYTKGMTERGKGRLANMLVHGCLLARRYQEGWSLTRDDLIRDFAAKKRTTPWAFCSNDGDATYSYQGKVK